MMRMLTSLRVKNFKRLDDVEVELGQTVVFIGPNNSGKTTALQALALWEIGLRKWLEKRSAKGSPEKRSGVTINRRDLIAVPVPDSNLLWNDLRVRAVQRNNGKQNTRNIRIEIVVSGVTKGKVWDCGFEFDFANQESFYCRPLRTSEDSQSARMLVPESCEAIRMAFLPPMSGLAATEDRLQEGAINVRIGEGRTAEVLRNLCYQIKTEKGSNWNALVTQIQNLFGVTLGEPQFVQERGQVTMSYTERDIKLDLVSSGRGLQQTLLLLAHLYTHPGTVLLLDEPDAHLEILRQRQIYHLLTSTAQTQNCQLIIASHSEVLLNEAADKDMLIASVGKPHRIDDRGSQLLKSLKAIGFEQYYQAEQTGWVLYLEGSTDLAILRALAGRLGHPAKEVLEKPFVHFVGNLRAKAADHFFGLKEAKQDLVGIVILDSDSLGQSEIGPLRQLKWKQREIENYLCFPETLQNYAQQVEGQQGLFEMEQQSRQLTAMGEAVSEVTQALKIMSEREQDPFGPEVKASDEFLTPVFKRYFEKPKLPNLMQKTDFHVLADYVPLEKVDSEVTEKLDEIVAVSMLAKQPH